jgi:flagellar biosynthesis protein FlhG
MFGQAERLFELKKLNKNQDLNSSSKIFAFTSGKGGTGKTFISLNLAYSLSRKGKKVLFLDLDSNLSNANIMINVVASKTIHTFFTEQKLLSELVSEYEPNLHFIFGDSGKLNYPAKRTGIISKMFNQLRTMQENYDFIFLDTGSGAGNEILSVLNQADNNIIVTLPEPTAVMDSYVMIKLLNANQYAGKKLIIVNKCIGREDGKITFDKLSMAADHFLKETPVFLGEVSFDHSVSSSIIAQELFLKKYTQSKAGQQIEKVSHNLNEFNHMANILQPEISHAF